MNRLNSCLIEGVLIADPEIHATENGMTVRTFTIESSRFFRTGEGGKLEREDSRFNVEDWSKRAEDRAGIGRKGDTIRVVGRLKQGRWNDPDDEMRSEAVIIADQIETKRREKRG